MRHFRQFIHEIHRRSLWQVLGLYLAGGWIVLQVVEALTNSAGLPDWVPSAALVVLLVGLPFVLATAFVQEGSGRRPAGREPDEATTGEEGRAGATPSKTPAEPVAPAQTGSGLRHGFFTWRNAAIGGIVALALLGLSAAGYVAMRNLGIGPIGSLVASGVIDKGEKVILADFEGDSAYAATATMAFRVDLAQTPIVSTAEPSYVDGVLERMERDPRTHLNPDLAREVAIREGIKAVVAGDVTGAGGSFVLSARLVAAESGEDLTAVRETAGDSSEIVEAIDRLSRKLRERLGESLRTIRASPPLDQVTTGSLEALRKYTQAWEAIDAGEDNQGIALLEEALGIDSTFAMAWRKLATVSFGDRRVEAATKAYEYRDKLTDRERYHTLGIYHDNVTEDHEQAITAYRTLLSAYPDDAVALNNLGVAYSNLGDREQAAEMYRQAAQADPFVSTFHSNLVLLEYELGRTDSATAALGRYGERLPGHPEFLMRSFQFATAERDYELAEGRLGPRFALESPSARRAARWDEMWLALIRGRVAEAERLRGELTEQGGELDAALAMANQFDLDVRRDTAAALRRAETALERYPMASVDNPQARPYDDAVFLYAETGRIGAARRWADEWIAATASADSSLADQVRPIVDVYLAAKRAEFDGRSEQAVELLRDVVDRLKALPQQGCDDRCAADFLGPVYEAAGPPDSVIAVYERYLSQPDFTPLVPDSFTLHRVYAALAAAYEEVGDLENAAKYYARFTELWADADPELQPRVQAAQARLEKILAERG